MSSESDGDENHQHKIRHSSIGSISKKEIRRIIGVDADKKSQEIKTHLDKHKQTNIVNNRKIENTAQQKQTEFGDSSTVHQNADKSTILQTSNGLNDSFKPKNILARTPPPSRGENDVFGAQKNAKRPRSEVSPDLIKPKRNQDNQVNDNNMENMNVDSFEIISQTNTGMEQQSTSDILEVALNSLETLHDFSGNGGITEFNGQQIRDCIFTLHKVVTKLAYKIGQVEKQNLDLTIQLTNRKPTVIENTSADQTDKYQTQTYTNDNYITPIEKTYSSIVKTNVPDPSSYEKWTTPPSKKDKHGAIIKIKDVKDSTKVLREIKQSFKNKGEGQQTFKSVKKLQGGGVLVECQNREQRAKLKETINAESGFEMKELQNKDPMIMLTGIEKGYKPEEFITALVEENPELKNTFGEDVDTKIKFITKRDCRNKRRENWIFQVDPTVFKWFIKNENINFDLTKVYVKEYCNPAMCYKCCLFGHVSKYCLGELCCHKCGGNHEGKSCPQNTTLDCPNCKRLKLKDRIHTARDPKCPAFLQKIEKYRESTNYGNQSTEAFLD